MSKPMTFAEFKTLLQHIHEDHSPRKMPSGVRIVKYVDPHIDMRTGTVFALKLRGFGWEQTFHTQNECRDLPESLFERCMAFLDRPATSDRW